MVHADAVIIFCDDIKKLLEMGNVPKAITGIESLQEQAEKEKAKLTKTYQIQSLNAKTIDCLADAILVFQEFRDKLNEIISYSNRGKF